MKRIKSFSLYIKESVEINDDMFQEFIDIGYSINIGEVYCKNKEDFRRGAIYSSPEHYANELKGVKITINLSEDNRNNDTMPISKYIEHLKELTQVFEVLESRLESELIIEYNPKMELYVVDKTEEIDNTETLNDLRQIKEYIEKKMEKTEFTYNVVLDEEDMKIRIMNVYNDSSKIQPIFKTAAFKNLNPTAKKIRFEKVPYRHQEENANYATQRFKLVSRIDN